MRHGKDFMSDKPAMTTLEQLAAWFFERERLGGHDVPADAAKANTLKRKACSLGHRPACPD